MVGNHSLPTNEHGEEESAKQVFERASINVFQGFDLSHRDMLINLVNAGVRRAAFDDLWADLRDETTV